MDLAATHRLKLPVCEQRMNLRRDAAASDAARRLDGEVAEAAKLLTIVMHCKSQATALQTCTGDDCVRARAAFTTCANEHAHSVVQALVQIASTRCPEQVAEFNACRTHLPGAKCEEQDLDALRCASRQVLLSSRAELSAG